MCLGIGDNYTKACYGYIFCIAYLINNDLPSTVVIKKQEVLGRTDHLFSFDIRRTIQKTKNMGNAQMRFHKP
jgi:hypothetical protein